MFDNLVRRDPRDGGKTIIPDLAHSWEIAKDGKTYTFFLRKGVQFHDGAELTADDVKATFDRIAKPPQGISIPRSMLFKAVSEINARDKYTVEFKLSEPRPANFMMSAIASGWNVILRKKTLEDNNYDLRKVEIYPGTGPFRSVRRAENEVWVMEKNRTTGTRDCRIWTESNSTMRCRSQRAGSAILSGRVDYVRLTDPVTARKAKATPGLSTTAFNQSAVHGTWVNNKRKPFDDPRVRRAMHLALDRPALVDVVKDVAPMQVGGFIYPFSEFATPREELCKRLGYQPDTAAALKEARALMAAAGHADGIKGLDFLVREGRQQELGAGHPGDAAGGAQHRVQPAPVVRVGLVRGLPERELRPVIGVIVSTLLDPSDYFNAWYRNGGPQNYSFWENKEFDALIDQIDREIDPEKRLALVRQAEAIMEQDPPVLPVAWEKINDVWYHTQRP